jgi:hypothetical protein
MAKFRFHGAQVSMRPDRGTGIFRDAIVGNVHVAAGVRGMVPAYRTAMPPTMLCVQFRNLLPSEDLLLFARTLWNAAQQDGPVAFQTGDATLSIAKSDVRSGPFVATLALEHGLQSVASDLEPLAAIEAAFAQLSLRPAERARPRSVMLREVAPGAPPRRNLTQPATGKGCAGAARNERGPVISRG